MYKHACLSWQWEATVWKKRNDTRTSPSVEHFLEDMRVKLNIISLNLSVWDEGKYDNNG